MVLTEVLAELGLGPEVPDTSARVMLVPLVCLSFLLCSDGTRELSLEGVLGPRPEDWEGTMGPRPEDWEGTMGADCWDNCCAESVHPAAKWVE